MANKIKNLFYLTFSKKYLLGFWLLILSVLVFIDSKFTNLGFLQLHSIDEFVFQGSLLHMYQGLTTFKLSSLFGFGFYQYGFGYFLLNLLITLPAFILKNYAWTIFLPRLVSSISAILVLVFLYKLSQRFVGNKESFFLVILAILMPGFWINATYFHPDWLMTLMLVISLFFTERDNWLYGKNYWWAVGFFALTVSIKYQALTFLPLLVIYIFYSELACLNFNKFLNNLVLLLKSLGLVILIFLLSNPYLLHPLGWCAFKDSLFSNLASNATNHGAVQTVSLIAKISNPLNFYYLTVIPLVVFFLAVLYYLFIFFKKRGQSFTGLVAWVFLINLFYLLFFVNKAWNQYYLPVFCFGLIIFIIFLSEIKNSQWRYLAWIFLLVWQLFFSYKNIITAVSVSHDYFNPDFNDWTESQIIVNANFIETTLINTKLKSGDQILLSPYTGFDFLKLGLDYGNIHTFFGCFGRETVERQAYVDSQRKYWGNLKTDEEIAKSFQPVNYLIIRKNLPFVDFERLVNIRDKEKCLITEEIFEEILNGGLGYSLVAVNQDLYIFKKP